ncbi:MAG: ribonuclease Z [Nanoarchaeota archaeon]|nr:ribonuclease Z [Nanoarchaeota archaeon]
MIEIVFLGTGSMFPTKKRAHPCIFVRNENVRFLFDCGEGAQRQMRIAGISPTKLDYIFITHWHGDHSLGLGGIIQSLAANRRKRKLVIYGPEGTNERVYHLLKTFAFGLTYKIEVNEIKIKKGVVKRIIDEERFAFEAMQVEHNVPCLSYAFIEKGRRKINIEYTKKFGLVRHPLLGKLQKGETIVYKGKKITPEKGTYLTPDKRVAYVTDTIYFKGLEKIAKGAKLLISEGTFSEELEEKAIEYTHMTAKEAAKLAKKAKVEKLILTHFSQRYPDVSKLKEEAQKIFKNVETANDFDKIEIK